MKSKNDYGRVMFTSSIYTLLIYLLISSEDEIEDTFFFFSGAIPESCRENLNSHYFQKKSFLGLTKNLGRISTRITAPYRWPFLKTAKLFGLDHLFFIPPLAGRREITVLEDGAANYDNTVYTSRKRKSRFKELIYGPRINQQILGGSEWDKKVILTGLGPIPEKLKDKAEIIDIKQLWESKSQHFKEWLLGVYDINPTAVEAMKSRSKIVIVQVLERHGVPKDIVVEIYKNMVKGVDPKELVIKPHPASDIDFQIHFPEAYVLREKIPMEILTLIGCEFTDAYTVCSTAVFSMPSTTKIHFSGTSVHPLVEKALGNIESNLISN